MHIRTVAAILMLLVAVFLIINRVLRSGWIFLIFIAMMITALIVYFTPRLKK